MADENIPETEQPVEGQEAPAAPDAAPEASQASINHEIRRLTRENAEKKQINTALLAAIQQAGSQQQHQPAPAEDGPPKREQFPDDFAFFEARQDHAFKEVEHKAAEAAERAVQATRERYAQEQRDQALRNSYNKGLQKHPDFDVVVQESATTITNAMVAIMSEHEEIEDIYYHLAKASNRAEAARIASLTPAKQAYEIGKIAENLKLGKVVATMEPMKPLTGGGAPAPSLYDTTSPSSDRLSDDEWFRRENERVRAKLGR